MRTFVSVVICAAVVAPVSASASSAPSRLVRDASRLSGLTARRTVLTAALTAKRYETLYARAWTRSYPSTLRRADATAYAAFGLTGRSVSAERSRAWYDVAARRLFVQRKPPAPRRALVHEVVRALIDQNFGLRRLVGLQARDRDQWLAANGIVEGTAALASGLKASPPRGTPLDRFSALSAAAGRSPGRALAAQLRYLGGRTALATALRTFPQTTEQLLHVDKFLERERALPLRLPTTAGGKPLALSETFGELDLRNVLLAFGVPAATTTAAGWGGGRLALYGDVAVIVLRWDSPEDAAEWQTAVPRYVDSAFPGATRGTCPPLDRCWSGPAEIASGVDGTTSVVASGPGAARVAAPLLTLK